MRFPPSHTPVRAAGRGRSGPLLGWALVLAVAGVLLAQGRGQAETTEQPDVALGASVYAANCTVCHGSTGAGMQGTDQSAGPALIGVDAAYVDLTMRTGRMPLLAPEVGVVPPHDGLADREREAVVEWMIAEFGIADSRPAEPIEGDIARGHELYTQHCAACHGATGSGGVSGEGTLILPVIGVDRVATVEAIRVGPFRMPRFATQQLSDEDAAAVAVFVDSLDQRSVTPLGLQEIDRVAMAVLVIPLILGITGLILLVARPVDVARSHRTASSHEEVT
ncbi:hypothetical protein BH23ACT9_BH23ACT9_30930 [soil metagenome]